MMNQAWQYFALTKSDDFVYVLGGFCEGKGVLNSCEWFSLKAWKWEVVEDMNAGRMNASACVI